MSAPGPGSEPQERRSALGADLVIPVLAAAFTVYFLITSANLVWEARANGTVIGLTLLALVAVQVGRVVARLRSGRGTLSLGTLSEGSAAQMQRLLLLGILALFIALIPWLGTTLGLFLVMAASMWVLGVRSLPMLLGIAAATAAIVYVLFIAILQSRLPAGPIEALLAPLLR